MAALLSVRKITTTDEETGETRDVWRLANADGDGFGDVVRAVAATGWDTRPRSNIHPALREYDSKDEAIAAAEELGKELTTKGGGASVIL